MGYDDVIRELDSGIAGTGLPCTDVRRLLNAMGFTVKDKRAGHKTVTHSGLPGFYATGYNCEGGNGPVKRGYLRTIRSIAEEHQTTIRRLMGE
jgi:hypothetical protein